MNTRLVYQLPLLPPTEVLNLFKINTRMLYFNKTEAGNCYRGVKAFCLRLLIRNRFSIGKKNIKEKRSRDQSALGSITPGSEPWTLGKKLSASQSPSL